MELNTLCDGIEVEVQIVRSLLRCHGYHWVKWRTVGLLHAVCRGRQERLVGQRIFHCLLLVI